MPDNVCLHCQEHEQRAERAEAEALALRVGLSQCNIEYEPRFAVREALYALRNAEHPGAELLAELDTLRASLSAANAVVAAQQGVIEDLRGEIDKFMTNELIQERDALFLSRRRLLRAGGIMWRALKRAWEMDEEQRVADAMRLVRALRDRDIEDARRPDV